LLSIHNVSEAGSAEQMETMEKVQKCEVQEQSYVPSPESFKEVKLFALEAKLKVKIN
jgi:hypothetical protein